MQTTLVVGMNMTINEKTKVELFAVISAGVVIAGFVFWLSTLYSIAAEAQRVNEKQDQKLEMLYEIKEDVAVIKKILETKRH